MGLELKGAVWNRSVILKVITIHVRKDISSTCSIIRLHLKKGKSKRPKLDSLGTLILFFLSIPNGNHFSFDPHHLLNSLLFTLYLYIIFHTASIFTYLKKISFCITNPNKSLLSLLSMHRRKTNHPNMVGRQDLSLFFWNLDWLWFQIKPSYHPS